MVLGRGARGRRARDPQRRGWPPIGLRAVPSAALNGGSGSGRARCGLLGHVALRARDSGAAEPRNLSRTTIAAIAMARRDQSMSSIGSVAQAAAINGSAIPSWASGGAPNRTWAQLR